MRVIWQSGSLSSKSATEEHFICVCVQAAGLAGMITRSQTPLVSSAFHQRVFFGPISTDFRHIDVWTQPRGVVFGLLRWHVLQQLNAETNRAGWWEYGSFLASQLSFLYPFPFHPILKRFWQHSYDKEQFLWAMPMRFIGTFSEVRDLKMGA